MTNTRLLVAGLAIALLATACGPKKAEEAAGEAHAPVSEHSSAGLPEANIANGEKLANAGRPAGGAHTDAVTPCVTCHGKDGAAPTAPEFPVLAGQYADYLASALEMYRDGRRQNPTMSLQAKGLDDHDIADLAAYFASRERKVYDLHEREAAK